jgi:hypothetical protein
MIKVIQLLETVEALLQTDRQSFNPVYAIFSSLFYKIAFSLTPCSNYFFLTDDTPNKI